MVYIKRIDLRGFKTFGKKCTVHLSRGLTVITGPNGSGKSNILDSVKFALGELSPKELRGETIGDLIHKGPQATAHRSAYVAVQFDNHDRRIPIDAEAVTISREFRRGGEGIYRLNGRRISRKQLTDILSSADIQVSSYNIVPQHAITRLAEVTTEERRRIIEDMIGIAVYDTKKASAQAELHQADVNLQVASAKIEEVRLRVESLERERNDYLKYVQIRKEINQLQSKVLSHKIRRAKDEVTELETRIAEHQRQLQELKSTRDELLRKKTELESEKREYEDSVSEKGSGKLLELQRAIGDVSATIASLRAQATACEVNITSLKKQKVQLEQTSLDLIQRLATAKRELEDLEQQRRTLQKTIAEKQIRTDETSRAVMELRERLGEQNEEAEELERSINNLSHRIIRFNAQIKASATKIDLLQNHLKTLRSRKSEYESTIQTITKRIEELNTLKQEQINRLADLDRKAAQYATLKIQRTKEIQHANEVAKRARNTLLEVETQTHLAETVSSEDKALKLLEDMAKTGVVSGVYGRLQNLIKVKPEYSKAAEAASAGWLKALVVKNIDTAISCIEALKRSKAGRVKLIPLQELRHTRRPKATKQGRDVLGPICEYMVFEECFGPAVDYVFGDTILTLNQKSAFLASVNGIRAVTVTGDLYEPGGGMETGYFRQPIDLAKLLLSGQTVEQLRNTLSSLERLTSKAKEEIARIEQGIQEQTRNKAQIQALISSTEREITSFTENLRRSRRIIENTDSRIESTVHEIGTEQAVLEASVSQKARIQSLLNQFEEKRDSLRIRSRSAVLLEKENEYASLSKELDDLIRRRVEAESRIGSLTSAIAVIEPTANQTRSQIAEIEDQLAKISEQQKNNLEDVRELEKRLKELQEERDHLSQELSAVKVKRAEYDAQLRKIDDEITRILEKLDPLNEKIGDLSASSKHLQMQIEFHLNELRELGVAEPYEVTDEEREEAEKTLPVLKKELSSIGGVNELAAAQYEEVKENYKHLATRIYELEKEKLSIIQFMNELDRQKHEAFMKAFNQVSQSFNEIFSTVTAGTGRLFLENPEKPFEGGADIRLQFPGKTEMTIGSASGGEKSVGTVCFILALQAIHPMPFYMMDEIDAHLDVVNSQRLAELLKSKSKGFQFIIVSLKDVTIARGDTVYGVFIQDGVSQVVGLPMQEVKAVGRAR